MPVSVHLITPGNAIVIVGEAGMLGVHTAFVGRSGKPATGVTEWWTRRPDGMEEGWTIARRPAGKGPIAIIVTVDGVGDWATGWTVGGLRAWDAGGRELGVTMRVGAGVLALSVDDDGAVYPITVDPVFGTPSATTGFTAWEVLPAGDVNGDGYDDVVMPAAWYSPPVFALGSPVGIVGPVYFPFGADDCWGYGASAAGIGDVNGDHYDDVVASSVLDGGGGCARVFLGSPGGIAASPDQVILGGEDYFSWTIGAAGDVNGDGYADAVIGSSLNTSVYAGSSAGLVDTPAWSIPTPSGPVQTGGDVDGDGVADLVVGDGDNDVVTVFGGSGDGLSTGASTTLAGETAGDGFGSAVASGMDVDGDGYDDLVVAAGTYGGTAGRIYLYPGSATGVGSAPESTVTGASGAYLGLGLSSAGDTDGDGYAEVLVESYDWNGGAYRDLVGVYEGGAAGLEASPSTVIPGGEYGTTRAAGVGDLDGDGYADVATGYMWFGDARFDTQEFYSGYRPDPTDADGDGIPADTDCNDADPAVGAPIEGWPDDDADGYGAGWERVSRCDHESDNDDDCDDANSGVHPDAAEVNCNGLDDDCNPDTLDGVDADGDNYSACVDCDDANSAVNPSAVEINCNGLDDDCNPDTLDPSAVEVNCNGLDDDCNPDTLDEVDADGDGYSACVDCDDANSGVHPDAAEIPGDGVDDDCDPDTLGVLDGADSDGEHGRQSKPCGGCATGGPLPGWLGLMGALGLLRRRTADPRQRGADGGRKPAAG